MKERPLTRTTLLAAIVAVLGSPLALADNNYTFDDAYWKRPIDRTDVVPASGSDAMGPASERPYDFVNKYNN